MNSKFDKIRPYHSADLLTVLPTLLNNDEFINTLVAFQFPRSPTFTKPVLSFFTKHFVSRKFSKIKTVTDFQSVIEPYMQKMIKETTSSLTITGLEQLDIHQPCLFVSNHRDIALDPAFVNWVLHINKQDTVRVAVGDNLLSKPWVADLLRLNKCFIVERSVEGRREKLNAAKLLSEYIHHSLQEDRQHLWIAQREGRAKDGIDITNPAIISMLTLHKPKNIEFADYIAALRIVPVSISYEFDPCDASKARELQQLENESDYEKPDNEDMRSIVNGITGPKGKVHVHFGRVLGNQCENTKEVGDYIDAEILNGYKIFSTSNVAGDVLEKLRRDDNVSSDKYTGDNLVAYEYLTTKMSELTVSEQHKLLTMYANPALRKQRRCDAV